MAWVRGLDAGPGAARFKEHRETAGLRPKESERSASLRRSRPRGLGQGIRVSVARFRKTAPAVESASPAETPGRGE